ncbi:MAG: response regulator [Candidatus Cloacimonadota bacterium]|nr:MAG: response regulator [Candidatus Cloacimonadota bacterium]
MKKILVAEDEPLMREALSEFLSMFSYQPELAEDGKAAWEKWRCGKYDLLISDINMPNMSGIELLRQVKEEKPDFPVILMTGVNLKKAKERARHFKADFLFCKPFPMKNLISTIEGIFKEQD